MSDMMTQEEAMNMSNEQAVQILIPMRNLMCDQNGCPISDAVFALDKAIEALSADRPQEWIPCSERLPHAECGESDNVLVTCESTLIRLLYFNGGNWCYPTGECYEHRIDKVVAWMPLPEPWEGADDD